MHTLSRNKQTIYYALLTGKTELTDSHGNRTGQYKLNYSDPVEARMNIRWDNGEVQLEGFGLNVSARRRMVTDDMNCPIDAETILWIGVSKEGPHNFVVVGAPEKSLNHIVYVVEEVNVTKAPVVSN